MVKGQSGVTHLGMEMAYQMKQLLHTPLKGRRFTARVYSQRQSVCVQAGEMANYPSVRRDQVDTFCPFVRLCFCVSPVVR